MIITDGWGCLVLDYDLIRLFRPIIINGLANQGHTVDVIQGYQSTPQGASDNTIFFFKINDRQIGSPIRKSYWNGSEMVYNEIQVRETTFQINALAKDNTITASDLCNLTNQILQTSETIETLAAHGVGILRVTEVRNPFFKGFDDNYEANPSFDFVLTHNQAISKNIGTITNANYTIKGI